MLLTDIPKIFLKKRGEVWFCWDMTYLYCQMQATQQALKAMIARSKRRIRDRRAKKRKEMMMRVKTTKQKSKNRTGKVQRRGRQCNSTKNNRPVSELELTSQWYVKVSVEQPVEKMMLSLPSISKLPSVAPEPSSIPPPVRRYSTGLFEDLALSSDSDDDHEPDNTTTTVISASASEIEGSKQANYFYSEEDEALLNTY